MGVYVETIPPAIADEDGAVGAAVPTAAGSAPEQLSLDLQSVRLTLEVSDPEVVAALLAQPAAQRSAYALSALRLGVMSLRLAGGQLDASAIRSAGDTLMSELRELLTARATDMTSTVASALSQYFDPDSGMVPQRLRALVSQDGELERLLRSHVGGEDSVLAKTLSSRVGEASPIFKMLAPDQAEGLQAQLAKMTETALTEQRERILREFSLDSKDSALRRLVDELDERHQVLRTDMKGKVDSIVGEFSLDQPDSALSRLVGRVEAAQKQITSEFSLDDDASALSRMQRLISEFRREVRESLSAITAQRKEAQRSTRHGLAFEAELGALIDAEVSRRGDVFESTGATTGTIRNCKAGDYVVTLGLETAAAGARIAIEAKQAKDYDLRKALDEIERARKNRAAQVGVFVFSAKSAPESLDKLTRYGNDLVVIWDPDEPASDVVIKAAMSTARALSVRLRDEGNSAGEALSLIERATRGIEKQLRFLDDITKAGETAKSSGDRICARARKMREDLEREVERLDQQLDALRTERDD